MSVMKQDKNEYKNYVDKISPKPSYVKNYIMAFLNNPQIYKKDLINL